MAKMWQQFCDADKTRTGLLNFEELRQVMIARGMDASPEAVAKIMEGLDQNQDF